MQITNGRIKDSSFSWSKNGSLVTENHPKSATPDATPQTNNYGCEEVGVQPLSRGNLAILSKVSNPQVEIRKLRGKVK